jgi:UPF0755 protein
MKKNNRQSPKKQAQVPKGKRFKKLVVWMFVLLVALTIAVGLMAYDFHRYAHQPLDNLARTVIIDIAPGQSFKKTTADLNQQGLITNTFKFALLSRITGLDKQVKSGEFILASTMTPLEVLQKMASSKVRLYRLTVPEGLTVSQVAAIVDKAGLVPEKSFIAATTDQQVIRQLQGEASALEGYLFPDTYHFPKNASSQDIVSAMIRRFQKVFTPEWKERAQALGFSVHEIVTLASIIEKETGAAFERPLISSVFHNRLKRKMRLETDPTVIYGLKNFDGNLTRKHLRTPTPYNTYIIKGLPPGPICSPGAEALRAALYPADSEYLFFVSKKDTTHAFSKTLKEHNRAVRKYQLNKR